MHWTQEPGGAEKMAKIQQAAWRKRKSQARRKKRRYTKRAKSALKITVAQPREVMVEMLNGMRVALVEQKKEELSLGYLVLISRPGGDILTSAKKLARIGEAE